MNPLDTLITASPDCITDAPGDVIHAADQLGAALMDALTNLGVDTNNVDEMRGVVAGWMLCQAHNDAAWLWLAAQWVAQHPDYHPTDG